MTAPKPESSSDVPAPCRMRRQKKGKPSRGNTNKDRIPISAQRAPAPRIRSPSEPIEQLSAQRPRHEGSGPQETRHEADLGGGSAQLVEIDREEQEEGARGVEEEACRVGQPCGRAIAMPAESARPWGADRLRHLENLIALQVSRAGLRSAASGDRAERDSS